MRGLSTFLIASSLLALGLTAPTGEIEDRGLSILEERADTPKKASGAQLVPGAPTRPGRKSSFPLDDFITQWFSGDRIKETLKYAAEHTKGGYEGWVQVEWDLAVKDYKKVKLNPSDREVAIYEGSTELADFVLDATDDTKGMIVELKTENKNSKGKKFIDAVKADKEKLGRTLKTKYQDYEKVAIGIAWSAQAQGEMGKGDLVDMIALDEISLELSGGLGTIKVYRLDVEDDITTGMSNMQLGTDPAPKPASDPAPACNQKRDGQECQSKTGSSNPTTGTKDKSGNASKNNKAGEAATAVQPAKSGKKKQASKPAKAGGKKSNQS